MAENENNTTADSAPATPPRRRRAASRPAGPPPEVAAPFTTPQTSAALPAAADAAPAQAEPFSAPQTEVAQPAAEETVPAEKPKRSRRATRPAAAAAPVAEAAEPVTESSTDAATPASTEPAAVADVADAPAPRTRRRAASRPAAAPAPVAPAPALEIETTETPEPAAEVVEARQEEAAVVEEKPTRRRRATRAAAPAEPVTETAPDEAPAVDVAQASDAPANEAPAAAAAPAQVAEAAEPAAAPSRRRRATRPAAAPAPVTDPEPRSATVADEPAASDEPAADDASVDTAELAAAVAAAEPAASEAPAQQERPARRRRGGRAAAAPVAEADDPADAEAEDGIAAALRMAEEAAIARRNLVSDPFSVTLDRQAQLAELAGAIAAGDQDDDDDEDDDEDDDLDENDDSDAEGSDDSEDSDDSDDDADHEEDAGDSDSSEDSDDDRPSRRRRRRGGRRRRRGSSRDDSSSDDADHSDPDDDSESDAAGPSADGDSNGDDDDHGDDDNGDDANGEDSESGVTRRRRRRRRRGDDGNGDSRSSSSASDEVTGIEGSTRMEAKRQRRRENRAAGRRRAPILSEAEFLARRESVDRKLLIRQADEYTQLAVVEDGILVEHYVDRASATSLIGNVYLGKVQNVLPSMEAAFIDIGRGRNAVLYAGEVDWDSFGVSAEDRKVEKVFKSGQAVLVQVTKDPVGAKGARLTGHISLPGRYIVYSPGGHLSGISRKLPDAERSRLREILGGLISDEESVIVRTAAEGASSEELIRDVNRLKAQWEVIEKKVKQGKAPVALYSEPDLTLRIVRDLFTEDFGKLLVQGNGSAEDSWDAISAYVTHVAPHLADRLEQFAPGDDGRDLFAEYRIDEQIAKALDRKVYLPSGGSLVIDRTEAMTVIDVNTGRFTGAGGNLEATVTSNNLEAAEEIVRQLRLRDLGGIIVIDFIDMVLPSNRELLLRRLIECLGRDRTRHQVAEVTSLGLVQLTRKRIGTGLAEAFTEECEHCHGSGYQRFDEPVDSQAPSDGGDRSSNGGHTTAGRRRAGRRGGDQKH